jgi:hypothetical protein
VVLEEFISEIRDDRHGEILFLDQYREPFHLRIVRGLLDVVRHYPEFPEGRRRWTDRVFFQNDDGLVKPLSTIWPPNDPRIVQLFMAMTRLVESRSFVGALRYMMRRNWV